MTSYPISVSRRLAAVTPVVVTPNMLATTAVRDASNSGGRFRTIPITAAAAFERIGVEMRLTPAMSVIAGNRTRSL